MLYEKIIVGVQFVISLPVVASHELRRNENREITKTPRHAAMNKIV
jgi:hypothetical protein